jgi:hypothetical protein
MTEARTALSKEETALLIRATWEALLAPAWLRNDLIELGKLIFAKVPLREVDEELFERLLPHLTTVAESLGQHLLRPPAREAAPPAPTAPRPVPVATPAVPAAAPVAAPVAAPTTPRSEEKNE